MQDVKLSTSRHRADGSAVAKHIRLGLGLFLLLLIYDGALRKWVLPGAEQLLFIAKDALLLGLLAYALLNRPRQRHATMPPAGRALFLLYVMWVFLEMFNLNLPNFLVGVWGLKAHLLYASLILLLPMAIDNLDDLFRWLEKAYPWIVVPVCALALVQLASPAESLINLQVRGGMEKIAYFGEAGLVRVTGTFSYITGMSSFVEAVAMLGMALFAGGSRSRLFLAGLAFPMVSLPATGSRGVIAVATATAVLILFAALAARLMRMRTVIHVVAVLALLLGISLYTQDTIWLALQQRAQLAEESAGDSGRAVTTFTNAFHFFDLAGLTGFGSGAVNLGAPALAREEPPFSWLPSGIWFEEESGRLVLELGILGWLISLSMRIAFFAWSVKLALAGRTRTIRAAAVLALPAMALGTYMGNGVFAPPVGAAYYWFCVALLAMAHSEHRQALARPARLRAEQLQTAVAR